MFKVCKIIKYEDKSDGEEVLFLVVFLFNCKFFILKYDWEGESNSNSNRVDWVDRKDWGDKVDCVEKLSRFVFVVCNGFSGFSDSVVVLVGRKKKYFGDRVKLKDGFSGLSFVFVFLF